MGKYFAQLFALASIYPSLQQIIDNIMKIVLVFLSGFGAELVYTILLNILRYEQIVSLAVLIRKPQCSFMLLCPKIEMAARPQPDLKLSVYLDSSLCVAAEG